jgi:hypothetical protein
MCRTRIPTRVPLTLDERPLPQDLRRLASTGQLLPRLHLQDDRAVRPDIIDGRILHPDPSRFDSCCATKLQETLDASFQEDDGVRRVNHYILKREIGRGSFGVVHLGIDSNTGEEFVTSFFICLIQGHQGILKIKATETLTIAYFTTDSYSWLC